MELLFWLGTGVVFYVYLGYPAVLALIRIAATRPVRKVYQEPSVSIVIAAYNERDRIERKIRNCLSLDYPKRQLQIVVSLDGSSDGSAFIVRKFVSRGVVLVRSTNHRGKAHALNQAMRRATGDIVVFADVRQTLDPAAIRELVANFADDRVGAVSGELVLMGHSDREANSEVGLYWRYEKMLRSMESDIHSVPGATGAIYAIRRGLYEELPEETLIDDVLIPMRIVLKGKRAVFDSSAKAYDMVACCPEAEFGRKVRTLAGNYQLLSQLPGVLVPFRNPVFFQFLSHKLGRLVVPYALIVILASNLFLWGGIYSVTLVLQGAWYSLAAFGYILSKRGIEVTGTSQAPEAAGAPILAGQNRKAA